MLEQQRLQQEERIKQLEAEKNRLQQEEAARKEQEEKWRLASEEHNRRQEEEKRQEAEKKRLHEEQARVAEDHRRRQQQQAHQNPEEQQHRLLQHSKLAKDSHDPASAVSQPASRSVESTTADAAKPNLETWTATLRDASTDKQARTSPTKPTPAPVPAPPQGTDEHEHDKKVIDASRRAWGDAHGAGSSLEEVFQRTDGKQPLWKGSISGAASPVKGEAPLQPSTALAEPQPTPPSTAPAATPPQAAPAAYVPMVSRSRLKPVVTFLLFIYVFCLCLCWFPFFTQLRVF